MTPTYLPYWHYDRVHDRVLGCVHVRGHDHDYVRDDRVHGYVRGRDHDHHERVRD